MSAILQDLRFAFRTLARDRAFTIVAVLTLAIALGANTAIFSVIDGILLQPLPFAQPNQLVTLSTHSTVDGSTYPALSWLNIADIGSQTKSLERLAPYSGTATFLMEGEEPERLIGGAIGHDVLPMLRVKPMLGRNFEHDMDTPGGPYEVILGYDLWKQRFHGDPHIIGRGIRMGLAGRTRIVIGVMPQGFKFPITPQKLDYWTPLSSIPDGLRNDRGAVFLWAVGRIRDGVSLTQARTEIETVSRRLEQQYPGTNTGAHFLLTPMQESIVGKTKPVLLVLLAAVAGVLLIGCANVANLLLARSSARHKELSVRAAIGATRGRIIGQLLVESIVLSLTAGLLGLLLAVWGVDALIALAPKNIPRLDMVQVNPAVLLFTLGLSVLTGIIFGLAPALGASKTDLTESLKEGTRGSTEGRSRNRLRSTLIVVAVALSLVLLVGAGLMLRSFAHLTGTDPGYDWRDAAVLSVSARPTAYKTPTEIVQFHHQLIDAISRIPGVTAAGAADMLPLGGSQDIHSFSIQGHAPFPVGREPSVTTITATPGYFGTMRIPLLQGRDFRRSDDPNAGPVIAVSQSFARQYFPNGNAVGQHLRLDDISGADGPFSEIVAVVGDTRFLDLADNPITTVYLPFEQNSRQGMSIVVRSPNAATLAPELRAVLRTLDRAQPLTSIETLQSIRADSLASRRFSLILLSLLSVLALILATVGIYSVMSYTVTQRTSEIGIRMALGAEARDVFRLIVGQALRLALLGVSIGLLIALAAGRLVQSFLYGVAPTDPSTFLSICALIIGVAFLASYLPARRAALVDPLVAMRGD